MSAIEITVLAETQRHPAMSVLALSFATDPIMRWTFPSADNYLSVIERYSEAFGGMGAETFGVKSGGINKFTFALAGCFMGSAVLLHTMWTW